MNLAPIILFVYNRPEHTLQTLEALSRNELADKSVLYIYSDGPKEEANDDQTKRIQQVKDIIRQKQWCKEVHIIEQKKNKGLADSIIDGVTEIINQYGKVIVLEDDLETGKGFLRFMNDGLEKYEREESVFQIAGFLFPIRKIRKRNSAYFLPLTTTWGWATWKRAWDQINFHPADWKTLMKDKQLSYHFNLDGVYDYTNMLMRQMNDHGYGSWGILFWWSVFKHNGLVLYPDHTLVQHRDTERTGTHKGNYNHLNNPKFDQDYSVKLFPNEIMPDTAIFNAIRYYLKSDNSRTLLQSLVSKLNNYRKLVSG